MKCPGWLLLPFSKSHQRFVSGAAWAVGGTTPATLRLAEQLLRNRLRFVRSARFDLLGHVEDSQHFFFGQTCLHGLFLVVLHAKRAIYSIGYAKSNHFLCLLVHFPIPRISYSFIF
jgi:hypothetical protein